MSLRHGMFRFEYVGEIGKGGFGRVDEIKITESNQSHPVGSHWACKRLNKKFNEHPQARERFEREILAIQTMSHPLIVSCHGQNLLGEERFYIMHRYPRNLRTLLKTQPNGYRWNDVANYGIRLAKALDYAHRSGFIHRDIKPENILLDEHNNPVIADWGLGYFLHKESVVLMPLTVGGMGTEYYCSFEQWGTGKCDQTGDVYSLGMLLAELTTGQQNPIAGVGMGLGNQGIRLNGSLGANHFNNLLKNMTMPLPQYRPQSMGQVAQILQEALSLDTQRQR